MASRLTDADRELWEERAGIREYDGGQSRAEAERGADEDLRRMRDEHDTSSQ